MDAAQARSHLEIVPSPKREEMSREVSCRALGVVLDGANARGIDPEMLLGTVPITLERLRDQNHWISWDAFTRILDNLDQQLGGTDDALATLGYENFGTNSFQFMREVAGLFFRPRDLYWLGTTWFGRELFAVIDDRYEDLPDGRIRETLFVREGYPGCRPLFRIMEGALRAAPGLVNRPDALVHLELTDDDRVATYTIDPPARASIRAALRSHTRRFFGLGATKMIEQLTSQQNQLRIHRDRLSWANEKIAKQKWRLTAVDRMGRELTRHVGLEALTEAIFATLAPLLPARGIALHVSGLHTPEMRQLGRVGPTSGSPARTLPMEIGGTLVGRLELWPDAQGGVNGNTALVTELVPWIAIALDNARAHEAVREYSELFASRATENTASFGDGESERLEREYLLEKLRRSEEQLRLVEAVASLDNLGVDVANQLIAPLRAIRRELANAKRDRVELSDPERVRGVLENLERQAQSAWDIAQGLSQFAHSEQVQKQRIDVNDAIRLAAADVRGYAKQRGALVDVMLAKEPCLAYANRAQIEQVIQSLIRNGLDAVGTRGRVRIASETIPGAARITVSDNGPGIAAADLERIFELFYSSRRRRGQSGVGLSAARSIVTEHGGTLRAESEETGATFVIELPSRPPNDDPEADTPANA